MNHDSLLMSHRTTGAWHVRRSGRVVNQCLIFAHHHAVQDFNYISQTMDYPYSSIPLSSLSSRLCIKAHTGSTYYQETTSLTSWTKSTCSLLRSPTSNTDGTPLRPRNFDECAGFSNGEKIPTTCTRPSEMKLAQDFA